MVVTPMTGNSVHLHTLKTLGDSAEPCHSTGTSVWTFLRLYSDLDLTLFISPPLSFLFY